MSRRYWINTVGEQIVLLSFMNYTIADYPEVQIKFRMKECSWFQYYLYKLTRINLIADDKFKWAKEYLGAKFSWQ